MLLYFSVTILEGGQIFTRLHTGVWYSRHGSGSGICNILETEDLFYFLLRCPINSPIRNRYLGKSVGGENRDGTIQRILTMLRHSTTFIILHSKCLSSLRSLSDWWKKVRGLERSFLFLLLVLLKRSSLYANIYLVLICNRHGLNLLKLKIK